MTHEERLLKAIEFNKNFIASKNATILATRDMIRNDEITIDEMNGLVDLYPQYEVGKAYAIGDIFSYEDVLYVVIQAHTSQLDWIPFSVPALYKAKVPVAVIPNWVQPTGAHDAYQIGDKVIFNTKTYESIINANTWSPTAYPQGWKLI